MTSPEGGGRYKKIEICSDLYGNMENKVVNKLVNWDEVIQGEKSSHKK